MIAIRSPREIEHIKRSCRIVVEAFGVVEKLMKPRVRTSEVDSEVEEFILSRGARPAFKGFQGYPANICISIDNQVVHGIPGRRKLERGQIVSVDIGVELEGYYGDGAKTFPIGEVSEEKKRLMAVTRKALYEGIKAAQEGNRLSDISYAVQFTVEDAHFSVVRDLVGHGIGRMLHEDPQIPNFGKPHQGPRLRAGMVLAIEPMVNLGDYLVRTIDDDWTVETVDGLPSAHFEHTVVVNKGEPEILTYGL
jgi:methionyl aminopeptidase